MRIPRRFLLFAVLLFLALTAPPLEAEDRTQFTKDIVVQPGEKVDDALCFFCSIHVRGTLGGDAVAIGGSVEVEGTVDGDVVASGGGVRLGPGATVTSEAVAVGGHLERGPQSSIGGDVESVQWFSLPGQREPFLPGAAANLAISLLTVGIFFLVLRQRRAEAMADCIRRRYVLVPLAGLVLLVVEGFLNNVGIHWGRLTGFVVSLVGLTLVITFGMGAAAVSYGLGRPLARGRTPVVAALFGAIMINLLNMVPVLGFLTFGVFALLALGCPLVSGFGKGADWLPAKFARRRADAAPTSSA